MIVRRFLALQTALAGACRVGQGTLLDDEGLELTKREVDVSTDCNQDARQKDHA
jgi:hypothetical protein